MILAIDPALGVTGAAGAALFRGGALVRCTYFVPPRKSPGERIRLMCEALRAWLILTPTLAIYEWPQVYENSPANPNDLVGLAAVGAAFATASRAGEQLTVLPREWKGSIDGDTMVERIKARLTPVEQALLPTGRLAHNAIDAVGIGLHHLGRLNRKRVIHR